MSLANFKFCIESSKHLIVLTGAGVSAESGIPTFRGKGGLWKKISSQDLATPQAFKKSPALVWQFYHYRRELVAKCNPNKGHIALAKLEQMFIRQNKKFTLITQNVDELHRKAGSINLIEMHGSLYKTICTSCKEVQYNYNNPICEALRGTDQSNLDDIKDIDVLQLPRCAKLVSTPKGHEIVCNGLLRPGVVWFGENLDSTVLEKIEYETNTCDLCLIIGTSSNVYPAALIAPTVLGRNVPLAEFNIEGPTINLDNSQMSQPNFYFFKGAASETLPNILLDV